MTTKIELWNKGNSFIGTLAPTTNTESVRNEKPIQKLPYVPPSAKELGNLSLSDSLASDKPVKCFQIANKSDVEKAVMSTFPGMRVVLRRKRRD